MGFQPGVIAICGPNGAGKTTILEAIAWALFDHLDYKRDDFVKRGTKRGQVTVSFVSDLDGREYVVTAIPAAAIYVYDPETKTRLIEQKGQVVPWLRRTWASSRAPTWRRSSKRRSACRRGLSLTISPSRLSNRKVRLRPDSEGRRVSRGVGQSPRHAAPLDTLITEADRKLAEAEGELKSLRRDEAAVR